MDHVKRIQDGVYSPSEKESDSFDKVGLRPMLSCLFVFYNWLNTSNMAVVLAFGVRLWKMLKELCCDLKSCSKICMFRVPTLEKSI